MAAEQRSWVRGGLLGAGSFASVSLAIDSDTGELFAVKSAECGQQHRGGDRVQALENELRILTSIASPRVVRCLGSSWSTSSTTGEPISRDIFLEYMPGGSLVDLMNKLGGRIQERLARIYTRGIVEGLEFLHSRRIVHCDIKGKNVLVGASGGIKLADFGAARELGSSGSQQEQSPSIRGTPLWMAPEVVRQEEQGTAADIWALGCTVLEMVSGRAPWSEVSDPFVALYRIGCSDDLPSLPSASILSEQGRDFVSKCLQRDPSKRWTSSQLLKHPFVTEQFVDEEQQEQQQQLPCLEIPSFESAAASPLLVGKWIVVKSPAGKPPSHDPFNNLSDFEPCCGEGDQASSSSVDQGSSSSCSRISSSSSVFSEESGSSSSWLNSTISVRRLSSRVADSGAAASSAILGDESRITDGKIGALFLGISSSEAEFSRAAPTRESRIFQRDRDPGHHCDDRCCGGSELRFNWIHLRHRLLWRMLRFDRLPILLARLLICKSVDQT